MACFDGIVALKELCDEQIPFSGKYLNDVGITRNFIDSVITSDYDDIQDFVDSKVNHAIDLVRQTIASKFGNKINASTLINNHRLGYTQHNMAIIAGGDFRGIQVTLNNKSNFINMELSEVSLQVDFTGSVDILVYDLYQNKLLETIPISAVAGEIVTVYPHVLFESSGKPLNLFIGYDSDGIDSITTYIRDNQCCGITSCTTSYLTSKGVVNTSGTFTHENMTGINNTAGLSVVYSLACDPYAWMCSYARALALPIVYKTASEMYLHGIQNGINDRSSNTTNLNEAKMIEVQKFYEIQYLEQIESVLHQMNVPKDSVCFQCKSPAISAIAIP